MHLVHLLLYSLVALTLTATESFATKSINEIYLEKLLKNLNTTADPCEDFYQYACGNWAQNYAYNDYLDMPGYMDHTVNEQLLQLLLTHKARTGIYEKLWQYYQSCEKLSAPALNHYLRLVQPELKLVWPIFRQDWNEPWQNETDFDWLSTIAVLRAYGLNGVFLTQNINVRLSNGSHYLIEMHQQQPGLVLKHKDVAEIFVNFGMSAEQSENVTERILLLEQQLKNLTAVDFLIENEEDDARYKNSFQEMSVQQLMVKVPEIDWRKYFEKVLDREIQVDREVVQTFALNFEYFDELLTILNATSNETISYYIMLKFMYQLNQDLPNVKHKSMSCVKHLRGYMPLAMNYLYEEHLYKSQRKVVDATLLEIYNKLRQNFEKLVEENHLKLNPTEREYILAELSSMQIKIGNVPQALSQQFVEAYYAKININSSNFYANHLQLLKHNTRQQQAKLLNQPIPTAQQFYEHDAETSSSSSPVKIFDNAVLVPYGYLQLPIFHHELNPLFQYSLFGVMLAHEIVHAYDLFHIVYDHHGNYNDVGVQVAQHFWQYINCFAVHPSESLSENIADVSGLRLAFQTYFDDVVNNLHSDFELSGTNFDSAQLFFINSVQFLCANMAKISAIDIKTLNLEHDMHDVRVRQNWANYEQFAKAFKCAPGTSMNPQQKCRLW